MGFIFEKYLPELFCVKISHKLTMCVCFLAFSAEASWLDVQCHGEDSRPLAKLSDEEYGPPQPDPQGVQASGTEGRPEAGVGQRKDA